MATYDELVSLYKPKKNIANVIQEGLGAVGAGMQGQAYTPKEDESANALLKAMILEDIKTKAQNERYAQDPVKQAEKMRAENLLRGASDPGYGTEDAGIGAEDIAPEVVTPRNPLVPRSVTPSPSIYPGQAGSPNTTDQYVTVGYKTNTLTGLKEPIKEKNLDYLTPTQRSKQLEKEENKQLAQDTIKSEAVSMLNSIKTAKKHKKYFGRFGDIKSQMAPETFFSKEEYKNRKEWENEMNKILAQKWIDKITQMKNASANKATGLGQMTETEGKRLMAAATALSKDLDSDSANYYLTEMEQIYTDIINRGSGKTSPTQPEQTGTTPEIGTTDSGFRYKGGDPSKPENWEKI